jgi:hypothetical protein
MPGSRVRRRRTATKGHGFRFGYHCDARLAVPDDADAVTAALTMAFFHDPVWAPVFPDESRRAGQMAAM